MTYLLLYIELHIFETYIPDIFCCDIFSHTCKKFISFSEGFNRKIPNINTIIYILEHINNNKSNKYTFMIKSNNYRPIDYFDICVEISPTSPLWVPTSTWHEENKIKRNREYHTIKSEENFISHRNIQEYPHIIRIQSKIDNSLCENYLDVAKYVFHKISKTMNIDLFMSGGVDIFNESIKSYEFLCPRIDLMKHRYMNNYTDERDYSFAISTLIFFRNIYIDNSILESSISYNNNIYEFSNDFVISNRHKIMNMH